MTEKPVFYDSQGRRSRQAVRLSATLGIVAVAILTVFLVSVFLLLPFIPGLPGSSKPVFLRSTHPPIFGAHAMERGQSGFLLAQARRDLQTTIELANARRNRLPKASEGGPVVCAFYSPDLDSAIDSLRQNVRKLTHLMPVWLRISADGLHLDSSAFDPRANPNNGEVVKLADQNGVRIYPVLNNNLGSDFNGKAVSRLLASKESQRDLIAATIKWLAANHFEGLNLDFENLQREDYARLPAFAMALSSALKANGMGFTADIEVNHLNTAASIAEVADFVVLMNYDESDETTRPAGPIASIRWFTRNLTEALKVVPEEKLVVGMANYGYDWSQDPKKNADNLTFQQAVILAREARDDLKPDQRITFDTDTFNSHFSYEDDDGHHEVWLLDGPGAYNQWKIASQAGVRGSAVWELGEEDPTIWNFLNVHLKQMPSAEAALTVVTFPYESEFNDVNGGGDILRVPEGFTSMEPGRRVISTDNAGLCIGAKFEAYPTTVVVNRYGKSRTDLALTFDDGPSSEWTPGVLDTLKTLGVTATFFDIGENAVSHPGLVRREYDEGHEIGSHSYFHPNMGAISNFRAKLELEATQRAIQSIIGRSTILFRPPYNADSSPVTPEDLKPVILASEMGYYTVAESIDPQDWSLYGATKTGGVVSRSAEDLAHEVMEGVRTKQGNVILLHDAGGDRHLTIEALKIFVPKLQAAGYRFVPVSDLIPGPMGHHMARDDVMPPLNAKDLLILPFDKLFFYSWFGVSVFLTLAFLIAIGLGLGRILVITPLALVAARRTVTSSFPADQGPPVSVIIAAFNEEQVIVRTVQSVLGSLYHNLEVIVVDDGSKDRTLEVVTEAFRNTPRVTVLTQENGGKASALNTGMAKASGEVHVYLDADTLLASDAVMKLVRHFADPAVGAVAGNVKVGNRINALTRLQAVEYIASQNLDRRAYAAINAITVVPGAIGAWRRTAVESSGGYTSDTLAEDMDLTWRVRLAGWKIDNESEAIAYTEAPATLRSFFKQRFRWAFGTLQCLFKHRAALGRFGWFGRAVLPAIWIYQIFLQVVAPFVDLKLLVSLGMLGIAWTSHSVQTRDWQPLPDATQTMALIGFMYALFFLVELLGAWIAFSLDKERKSLLWWLFVQRFFYRQVMYAVVWKSLWTAIRGRRTGWGKFERLGTVHGESARPGALAGEGSLVGPATRDA